MADRVETIGIYSAYGFAKEAGYTGTKAEFEQGLKNSAEYADNAASSANAATNAKNAAVTAKTDAQAAQSAAETAQGLAEDAQAAAEEAKNDAEAAAASLDASTIARIDGFYENMGVGTADQLMASQKVHNSDPYIFRTSGGISDIGNREELEIVGGSIVWNQLSRRILTDQSEVYGITRTASEDRTKMTYTGTATKTDNYTAITVSPTVVGHKVLITLGNVTLPSGAKLLYSNADKCTTTIYAIIYNTAQIGVSIEQGTEVNFTVKPQLFDLTAMFGSEIADHIYELEQAEEGAGVAWFRKYFPNDYYEYNAGELMHVSDLQSHDTVGFNAWDEEWEQGGIAIATGQNTSVINAIRSKNYIPCFGGTKYFLNVIGNKISIFVLWYDANKNFISYNSNASNALRTSPSNACYFRLRVDGYGNTYNNDICINLSWSGTRDGEYEPYVKHSYPLDSSLTLRGIPKLTADGDLTYDGDIYKPDGTVERRYGVVDLGELSWEATTTANRYMAYLAPNPYAKPSGSYSVAVPFVTNSKYAILSQNQVYANYVGLSIQSMTGGSLYIYDDTISTAEALKASLVGKYLVYELAEPTTEESEPYTSPQIVDDWGTEEFVTTSIVPVGHNTSYPANLRDKLQHLPDLPDNDGYYMTQVTGTQMSLIRFRIPQAPAEDGEYILKATVSNGTPTYTWEAVVEAEGGEG